MTDIRHVALVADDDEFFCMAITSILLERLGVAEVIAVGSLDEALEQLAERRDITIALFDLAMPGMQGPANIGAVRDVFPDVLTAVVSASQSRLDVLTTLESGAHGYVPKGMGVDDLTKALADILGGSIYVPRLMAQVSSGAPDDATLRFSDASEQTDLDVLARLTPRQRDVMEQLVKGKSNKAIARDLKLSEGTVKIHVAALFRNLGVRNRATAALAGARLLGLQ